jgi:RHS repeat-associated protein
MDGWLQYSEKNDSTGWNEFELRMYDARFGRWLSVDPYGQYASPYVGMGNAPNMGVDPDGGLFSFSPVGACIGAVAGGLAGYFASDGDSRRCWCCASASERGLTNNRYARWQRWVSFVSLYCTLALGVWAN